MYEAPILVFSSILNICQADSIWLHQAPHAKNINKLNAINLETKLCMPLSVDHLANRHIHIYYSCFIS